MQIKGKDLNLYLPTDSGLVAFCYATDCEITLTADIYETTTYGSGAGKTYNYRGVYGYTLSLNGATTYDGFFDVGTLQSAIINREKLLFTFTDNNQISYTGRVLIPEVGFDSPADAISLFTSTLMGDGELIITEYGSGGGSGGLSVNIVNQLGEIVAVVPAPGQYNVVMFDTIRQGGAWGVTPDLIITSGGA